VLTTVLTAAVLAFVGIRLAGAARIALGGPGRQRIALILRGIRWRHLWPVPVVLTGVLVTAVVLLQVPGLSFGWWFALGGTGNPVTGGTEQTAGTALEWLIPAVFLTLLVPALPLFAFREEEIFRLGCESWSWPRRVWKAVLFGAVHAVIGIPIGVALALSVGGAYFQWTYLRGYRVRHSPLDGLLESTRAHTAYNLSIVGLLVVGFALLAVAG
jgi:hypothetical protein